MDIYVENIKCGGCASSIKKKLVEAFNTDTVEVDVEQGLVSLDIEDAERDAATQVLLDLGYPETDSVHGFDSAKAKAKSFVACAIGRMDKDA